MKFRPMGVELFHADRPFGKIANAPKKQKK